MRAARLLNKRSLSWALYDWANSAFATAVMAGFFPVFFKQYWAQGLAVEESTFWLGAANSVAGLAIVLLAPVLGAVADRGGLRKRFLGVLAAAGILLTALLYTVGPGAWSTAAILYGVAVFGFMGANIFYDALLLEVANKGDLDRVSAFGFALGYLGGGLLFSLTVAMSLAPQWFGLEDQAQAVRSAFLVVAVWWALFSLPIFLVVREPTQTPRVPARAAIVAGLRQLRATFREVRRLRVVMHFLLAYWLYIDAVDTIIRMAVDYGLSIGLSSDGLILALLITQFVGFPASLFFGWLGGRFGAKRGVLVCLGVYCVISLWAYSIQQQWEFYAMAVGIGLVQGGVQALSRSLYARLIPRAKAAEFFGFFNMWGKFAAVLGPVLMGWVSVWTGNPRYSIFVILALLLAGGLLLTMVNERAGQAIAEEL